MRKVKLFVYGTLKDPEALTRLLGDDRWRALGAGSVQATLFDLGDYPGLVESQTGDDRVQGVVIEVGDADVALARLDAYEGVHDGLYVRREMSVRLDTGRAITAWAYLYNRPVGSRRRIVSWPPSDR